MKKYGPGVKIAAKKPIVKELAKNTDIPYVQASFIYDVVWSLILKELKAGHDVMLPGVGRFQFIPSRKDQKSNLTGQIIPEHKRLRFNVNVSLGLFIRTNTRVRPIK
jgi:nucleoid DNA-binding protein